MRESPPAHALAPHTAGIGLSARKHLCLEAQWCARAVYRAVR
jgi:hypothetical protein